MIVVLYNAAMPCSGFLSYLINECKDDVISCSENDLVRDVQVEDVGYSQNQCTWHCKGVKINFSDVSGVYNYFNGVPLSALEHYASEDRDFIQAEWRAYLTFRLNNIANCINKPSKIISAGTIYQLPFIFHLASKAGFLLPKYIFSGLKNELELASKQYKLSLWCTKITVRIKDIENMETSEDCRIGCIEAVEGKWVIIHIVEDHVISWIAQSDNKYERCDLPAELQSKLFKLRKLLGLRVVEVHMKVTDNGRYYFQHFSHLISHDFVKLERVEESYHHIRNLLCPSGK